MPSGIYIHVPFCEFKCGYCDFFSITDLRQTDIFRYGLEKEVFLIKPEINSKSVFDTIYLGGGTPSILSSNQIHSILDLIYKNFSIQTNAEITIEVNPGTINIPILLDYKKAGINRLSIGVQSFDNKELNFLGRIHDAEQAISAIKYARQSGFENISIDLIYAIPGQTLNTWQKNMQKAVDLSPEHISAYNLTIEPNTPFYDLKMQGKLKPISENKEEKFFSLTDSFLSGAGYNHYEISNFSMGTINESQHNKNYWQHQNYLGFGPAAHSFWNNIRWGNYKSVEKYSNALQKEIKPHEFIETLQLKDLEFEHIFLSLRTYKGLNLEKYQNRFNEIFIKKYNSVLVQLIDNEYANKNDEYFFLTRRGMVLYDEILPKFILN